MFFLVVLLRCAMRTIKLNMFCLEAEDSSPAKE